MSARTKHLRTRTGARCGRKNVALECDETWVSCLRCRDLGRPFETVPDGAYQLPSGFLPVTGIDGGERGYLNVHNVIFVDGGSCMWFEEPDILAIMHAREGHTVRRYEGTWEIAERAESAPVQSPQNEDAK